MRKTLWEADKELFGAGWSESEVARLDVDSATSRFGFSDRHIIISAHRGVLLFDRSSEAPPRLLPLDLDTNDGMTLGFWLSESFVLVSVFWTQSNRNELFKIDLTSWTIESQTMLPEGVWILCPRRQHESAALLYEANQSGGLLLLDSVTLNYSQSFQGSHIHKCIALDSNEAWVWHVGGVDTFNLINGRSERRFLPFHDDEIRWTTFLPLRDDLLCIAGYTSSLEDYILGALDATGVPNVQLRIPLANIHPAAEIERLRDKEESEAGWSSWLEFIPHLFELGAGRMLMICGGEGEWIQGDWGRCAALEIEVDKYSVIAQTPLSETDGCCFACRALNGEVAIHLEGGRIALIQPTAEGQI